MTSLKKEVNYQSLADSVKLLMFQIIQYEMWLIQQKLTYNQVIRDFFAEVSKLNQEIGLYLIFGKDDEQRNAAYQ